MNIDSSKISFFYLSSIIDTVSLLGYALDRYKLTKDIRDQREKNTVGWLEKDVSMMQHKDYIQQLKHSLSVQLSCVDEDSLDESLTAKIEKVRIGLNNLESCGRCSVDSPNQSVNGQEESET